MAHERLVTDRAGARVVVKVGTRSGAKIAAVRLDYAPLFRAESRPSGEHVFTLGENSG